MTAKQNTAAEEQAIENVRITSARGVTRSMKTKLAFVPENSNKLLSKELDACVRATD